jgi:hypothetical protein
MNFAKAQRALRGLKLSRQIQVIPPHAARAQQIAKRFEATRE